MPNETILRLEDDEISVKIHVYYLQKRGNIKKKIGFTFNGNTFHNCTFPVSLTEFEQAIKEKKNYLVSMYDTTFFKEVFISYIPKTDKYRFICVDYNNDYYNLGAIERIDFITEMNKY